MQTEGMIELQCSLQPRKAEVFDANSETNVGV